jgi:hypothetical protein
LVAHQVRHRQTPRAITQALAIKRVVHPRATAFVCRTAVGIEVKRGDVFAGFVGDTEEPHIGMPHRRLAIGGAHADTEQAFGGGEQTVEHTRQSEVRTQLFVGEVESFFTQTFSPETDVPVRQRERRIAATSTCERGQFIQFDTRLWQRSTA